MTDDKQTEGWQAEKHFTQRTYHYIRDQFSLCRKLCFYRGELMSAYEGPVKKEDCKTCFKRLSHERK